MGVLLANLQAYSVTSPTACPSQEDLVLVVLATGIPENWFTMSRVSFCPQCFSLTKLSNKSTQRISTIHDEDVWLTTVLRSSAGFNLVGWSEVDEDEIPNFCDKFVNMQSLIRLSRIILPFQHSLQLITCRRMDILGAVPICLVSAAEDR